MASRTLLLALQLLALCVFSHAAQIVHLDKQNWRLQNANQSISLTTQLPAYPLEVLRANGVIKDPNWRSASAWVAMQLM